MMLQITETERLHHESALINDDESLSTVLNLFPLPLVIINSQRQVIFVNATMRDAFKLPPEECAPGRRPGELFKCSHVQESNFKCGTSQWCCYCGISNAVKTALATGDIASAECVVSGAGFNSRCMKVLVQPYPCHGEAFFMLVFQDVSDTYRRGLLERIFFHDLQNLVMMLTSAGDLQKHRPDLLKFDFTDYVMMITEHMEDEIVAQREMLDAESNVLKTVPAPIHSHELLNAVVYFFERSFSEQRKTIRIADDSYDLRFISDVRLVRRVLVNMVKNALEATPPGAVVSLRSTLEDGLIRLAVHNPGIIPHEIGVQLFQQTFSTKGSGRGMGTYSIKLLSEKYLSGRVGFTSTPESGTEFFVIYPIGGPAAVS